MGTFYGYQCVEHSLAREFRGHSCLHCCMLCAIAPSLCGIDLPFFSLSGVELSLGKSESSMRRKKQNVALIRNIV